MCVVVGPPGYPASRPPFAPHGYAAPPGSMPHGAPHGAPHVAPHAAHAPTHHHVGSHAFFAPKKWKVARNNTVVRKTETWLGNRTGLE